MAGAAGFTPESPIWRISREWALMLGGGRALLLQVAQPLALAGVGPAQYVRRAVVPLLPDLARALPAARRAERLAPAA